MYDRYSKPSNFLWVLRAFITGFLIGYLIDIILSVTVAGIFPAESLAENLTGIVFLIAFTLAYYLMWVRRETLAGMIFILWYAGLWPADLLTDWENFRDAPLPGILIFIPGLLLLYYRIASGRKSDSIGAD